MSGLPAETVVAFDVDGTLTTRDSVTAFLRRFAARPIVLVRAFGQSPRVLVALAGRSRDGLRAAATAAVFRGVPLDEVEGEAERFARDVIAARLRADTVARLRWHVAEGHRVVLVSASYEVYLHRLAEELGAEAVLATRLAVDESGRCTGQLNGANCRATEKAVRLAAWLDAQGLRRDEVDVWAYGDSPGDLELLEFADHPVWVAEPLASVAPSV